MCGVRGKTGKAKSPVKPNNVSDSNQLVDACYVVITLCGQ